MLYYRIDNELARRARNNIRLSALPYLPACVQAMRMPSHEDAEDSRTFGEWIKTLAARDATVVYYKKDIILELTTRGEKFTASRGEMVVLFPYHHIHYPDGALLVSMPAEIFADMYKPLQISAALMAPVPA